MRAVRVDPAGLVRRAEPRGDAGEPPAEAVVAGNLVLRVPREWRPAQYFVEVPALLAGVNALPVVRGRLPVAARLEELPGGAVHLQGVLHGRQLVAPVAREVRPPGHVERVVSDVADAVMHQGFQVPPHVVEGLSGPPEDQIHGGPEPQRVAGLEHPEDVRRLLLAPLVSGSVGSSC